VSRRALEPSLNVDFLPVLFRFEDYSKPRGSAPSAPSGPIGSAQVDRIDRMAFGHVTYHPEDEVLILWLDKDRAWNECVLHPPRAWCFF
jgi:hypothetical protein